MRGRGWLSRKARFHLLLRGCRLRTAGKSPGRTGPQVCLERKLQVWVAITQPLRAALQRQHRYFPVISAHLWSPRQAWRLGGGAGQGASLSLPFPRHAARPNRADAHLSEQKTRRRGPVFPLRCPHVSGEPEALVQNG